MQQFNMEQKEEYKETELGLLPGSWEFKNFEKCINKEKIKVGKIKKREFKNFGKYPIVDQGQSLIAGYWDKEDNTYQGDLPVIIFGDHTRILKFVEFPFVCGADGTKIIVPNLNVVNPKFFYYSLKSIEIPSRGYNRHYSLLKENKIACPPIPEQKKIADILSTIQEAKEKTENVINSLKEFKKSIMKHLFAYGPVSLEEIEKVKLKDTEIGMVPEEWESTKLGYIFKEVNHKIKNTEIDKKNIPILSMTRYKGLILQKMKFGKRVASRDILNYKIIKKGQLAYGFPMDEGVIYFLKDYDLGAVSPVYLTWDLVDERIDKDYLDFLLKSPALIEKYKSLYSTVVHRRRIVNKSDFKNITIYYPSLSEQKQIVLILLILEESIEKEKNKRNALEELFKSMLHNLMTAKIRVNNLEI